MKHLFYLLFLMLPVALLAQETVKDQNWTASQLMQPETLAQKIENQEKLPLIISIGPQALIPHSKDIGMLVEEPNRARFDSLTDRLSKKTPVVIYCGCCPFDKCPNVRPAIAVLKEKGFENFHLLNLSTSLKADWIDHNYPLKNEE